MRFNFTNNFVSVHLFILVTLLLSSCSVGYVTKAGIKEAEIILSARHIRDLLTDTSTPELLRSRLQLIVGIRDFASSIGLRSGRSYLTYADVGTSPISWVVIASKADSFSLKTWWFPIVGEVPYLGFFSNADAKAMAAKLESEGFETLIRPVDAFSTLGWLPDPALSTFALKSEVAVAETILHELLHNTIWIKNRAEFNESLANFVGMTAAIEYFKDRVSRCEDLNERCAESARKDLKFAEGIKQFELHAAKLVFELHKDLSEVYSSSQTQEVKLTRKSELLNSYRSVFCKEDPQGDLCTKLNNATILANKAYLTGLGQFEEIFNKNGSKWKVFFEVFKNNAIPETFIKSESPHS